MNRTVFHLALALVLLAAGAATAGPERDLARGHEALAGTRLAVAAEAYAAAAGAATDAATRAEAWRGAAVAQLSRLEADSAAAALVRAVAADPGWPGNATLLDQIGQVIVAGGPGPDWDGQLAVLEAAVAAAPHLRSRLLFLAAATADVRGEFARADSLRARLGGPDAWQVLGPFHNAGGSGIDGEHLAGREIDLTATYRDLRGRPIGWLPVRTRPPGRVDLDLVLDNEVDALAYAVTHVRAGDAPVDAVVHLYGSGAFHLWVDGDLVLSEPELRAGDPPLYEAPVRLRAGWNRILVKAGAESEALNFGLHLTGPDGEPLPLETSADPAVYEAPPGAADGEEAPVPAGLDRFPPDGWLHRWQALLPEASLADVYLHAEFLIGRGFTDEGLAVVAAAAERFGESALLDDLRADAYEKRSPGEAEPLRRRLAEAAPELLLSRLSLITGLLNEGDEDEAWRLMEETIADRGDHPYMMPLHGLFLIGRGSVQEGMAELRRTVDAAPGNLVARSVYLSALREQGVQAEYEAQVAAAVAARPDDVSLVRHAAALAYNRQDYDKALTLLDLALAAHGRPDQIMPDRAEVLRQLDRPDDAVAALREGLTWSPMSQALNSQLADLLVQAGREQEALPYLERLVQLDPTASDQRELIRKIRGEPPLQDLFPEVDVDELAGADLSWVEEGAVAVQLLDSVELILYPDGAVERRHHEVRKILTQGGVELYRKTDVPGFSGGEVEIARSIKPDGRRIEAERSWGEVAWSDLEPGDLIEMRYVTRHGPHVGLADQFWTQHYFQLDLPVMVSRLAILLPRERDYRVQAHNLEIERRSEDRGPWRLDVWEARRMAGLPAEADMPPDTEPCAWLDVSTVPDWDAIVAWYDGISRGRLRMTPDLRELAAELGADAADDSVLIRRVAHHVTEEIRNEGGSFIQSGQVPRAVAEVHRTGFGDCKDQSGLVLALLRELGVDACYALVNSRDETTVPYLPSPRFTHAVVRARAADGRTFWIDPTAKGLSFPDVPVNLEGAQALLIDPAAPQFVTIGLDPAELNGCDSRLEAVATPEGDLEVTGSTEYRGEDAQTLRSIQMLVPEREREAIQDAVDGAQPGAALLDYTLQAGSDLDEPVVLGWSWRRPAAATFAQDLMLLPAPWLTGEVPQGKASLDERRHPLVLDSWKGRYRERVDLTLPDGYELFGEPEPVDLACDGASFHLEARPGADGRLVLEKELRIDVVRVEPDRYPAFREFIRKAYKAQQQPLVLKRAAAD